MHGHAIHYDDPPADNIKTNFADKVKALVFHKHSEVYWNKRGFTESTYYRISKILSRMD